MKTKKNLFFCPLLENPPNTKKYQLVNDVSKEKNYISCDIEVKSEIVVPIFVDNKNIGQIDVDSKKSNAFDENDENFLKQINYLISKKLF